MSFLVVIFGMAKSLILVTKRCHNKCKNRMRQQKAKKNNPHPSELMQNELQSNGKPALISD